MQTLQQARRLNSALGEPIHSRIKGMAELDVHIRRGQVTMVAAGPGTGKSAFVQAVLHHGGGAQGPKNSTLYFSADSGPEVMYERAGALSTRMDMETVRRLVEAGNTEQIDAAIAARHSHVIYDFTSSLTIEHIERELEGYLELNGRYPEVIVVDNLKNAVDAQDADETRATEDAVVFLNEMARETSSAVIVLHHVGGWYENGDLPIPLNGLRHKVGKTPALVLTLYRPSEVEMNVSIVKNRGGVVRADGSLYVRLNVNLARMEFSG